MVRIDRISTLGLACAAAVLGLAGAGAGAPAFAAGSIKAAYVEQVIPSHAWSGHMQVLNATKSVGPGTGILGVTSFTLTNFDSQPQQVFIFVPIFSGGGCGSGGSNIVGGTDPQMTVYVQPQQTLHLAYPTPLVFNPNQNNVTCVAAEVTTLLHGGSVEIDVNGLVN